MYKNNVIAAVIPAYNEETQIGEVLCTIPEYVDIAYVIDDGSSDSTCQVIEAISAINGKIKLIRHSFNKGVGAAILSGYMQALKEDVDIAVVMAGDGQMDPAYLPWLLDPIIMKKADYTKGNRMSCIKHLEGMSAWRRFGNYILQFLTCVACGNFSIKDPQNGYTAISKECLKKLELSSVYPYYGYCNDLLVKLCISKSIICEVPMPSRYGNEKSKIRYTRYIPKVSALLLRSFLHRLRVCYLPLGARGK